MASSFVSNMAKPCIALALGSALSGCVAALAVPAMTAAGVLTERKDSEQRVEPATPVAAQEAALQSEPAENVQLTELTELPPPSPGPSDPGQSQWQAFATYALGRAAALSDGDEIESALLAPDSAMSLQARKRICTDREPAVLVDIDPGKAGFTDAPQGPPSPGAASALATLRDAGVVVLWISQASSSELAAIADALKNSGLDPTGRDPILLALNQDDRKQVLREQANEAVCMLAIAGDERADFDELFDYLRDPTLGTMYDSLLGAGWFLVPAVFSEGE